MTNDPVYVCECSWVGGDPDIGRGRRTRARKAIRPTTPTCPACWHSDQKRVVVTLRPDPVPVIELAMKDLVGTRRLQAVGRRELGDSQQVAIQMDDQIYLFTGSGDSWRDSVDSIRIVTEAPMPMAPIHPPLVVEVRHRSQPSHSGDGADAIYAINERTDLCVLDIGTDNIDDCYPSFVFQWQPEGWRWPPDRDPA